MNLPDIDRVTELLGEVVAEEVMPRFRRLREDEIERKPSPGDPHDVVTVVDRRVEEFLGRALPALTPPAPVLGEEAAHARPELVRLVQGDEPLWLLDPIDGTRSFVRGRDAFGVMLAWVSGGLTRAAWIVLPARGRTYVAEEGAGAFRDGARVRVPARPAATGLAGAFAPPRGTLYTRYMPPEVAAGVQRAVHGRYESAPASHCSAIEYTDVIEGAKDFAIYYRLLPWDHAPGALILTEAGGRVEHLDGSPYTPRSRSQITVVAGSPGISTSVRRLFPT